VKLRIILNRAPPPFRKEKSLTRTAAAASALALLAVAAPAYADERYFVWGYNAFTPAAGEREIEAYVHAKNLTGTFEHQLAFDYGITDNWAVEPYLKFSQTGLSSFSVASAKLQTRYRFVDDGDWNPALAAYAEVEQPFNGKLPVLEGKLLAHKDFGPLQFATNLVAKQSLDAGSVADYGMTLGASLPLTDWFVVAAEAKASGLYSGKDSVIAGPTAFVKAPGLKLGLGYGQDLTGRGSNQIRGKLTLEF
jgi:hypothetical protein